MRFDELQSNRNMIYAIAEKHGISNIRVFGSTARGDEDASSDVDLMVHVHPTRNLFDMVAFKDEVSDFLQLPVDVVEIDAVKNPLRKRYMLADAVPL
jgi:uncharacterized protein